MPPPPRQQPYAFASSNPSAASSSQNQQFYNRLQQQQQQQRQPPNAPPRGYTAAPGAASAISLLPPGQRNASSDSVVRIFPLVPLDQPTSGSHRSLFSAVLESLQFPSPWLRPHHLRQGKRHRRFLALAQSLAAPPLNGAVLCPGMRSTLMPDQDNRARCYPAIPAYLQILRATQQVSPWSR